MEPLDLLRPHRNPSRDVRRSGMLVCGALLVGLVLLTVGRSNTASELDQVLVTVPPGLHAGDLFNFKFADEDYSTRVPFGNGAGDVVKVDLPAVHHSRATHASIFQQNDLKGYDTFLVRVPSGMHGGDEFKVNIPGQGNVLVKVPSGQSGGAKLLFNVPKARRGLVALASDSSTNSEQQHEKLIKRDEHVRKVKLLQPKVAVQPGDNGEEKITIVLPAASELKQSSISDAAIERLNAKMKKLESQVHADEQEKMKEKELKTVYKEEAQKDDKTIQGLNLEVQKLTEKNKILESSLKTQSKAEAEEKAKATEEANAQAAAAKKIVENKQAKKVEIRSKILKEETEINKLWEKYKQEKKMDNMWKAKAKDIVQIKNDKMEISAPHLMRKAEPKSETPKKDVAAAAVIRDKQTAVGERSPTKAASKHPSWNSLISFLEDKKPKVLPSPKATDDIAIANLDDDSSGSATKGGSALVAKLVKKAGGGSSKVERPVSLKPGASPFKEGFSKWYKDFKALSHQADQEHASMIKNYKKVKKDAVEVQKMQDHDLKADEDSTQGLLALTKILSDYGATKLLKGVK
mmetsp:Transcript_13160/g.30272  ORF Transcript_13160/g.30272 Transcript_13160/m.30272 type:complete len:576 (-) Transcript_13160:63-1790(-)